MQEEVVSNSPQFHPILPGVGSIPSRPSEHDDYVKKRAMEMLLPNIVRWMQYESSHVDEEEIAEDLAEVMFEGMNGYEIARELERHHGWDGIDAELVELLDDAWSFESRAIRELTIQWVRAYNIECPFQIDQLVKVIGNHGRYKNLVGKIIRINEDEAKCSVWFSDMPSSSALIVPYESLESTEEALSEEI